MKKTNIILAIAFNLYLFILLSGTLCYGQDIHFSQSMSGMSPLMVNPALTAAFKGDQRVLLNYKNQWSSVTEPYKTYAFSFDMPFARKKWNNSYLGAGLFVFNDKAGDAEFGSTQVNISLSGVTRLNKNQTATVGLQGGFAQQSMSSSNLRWGNQYEAGVYDAGLNTGEAAGYEPSIFGDFSAGVSWRYGRRSTNMSSNDMFGAGAGIALFHLNRPKLDFNEDGKLYTKLVVNGDIYWGFKGTNIALLPALQFTRQGPVQEMNIGAMVRYTIKENSKYTNNVKGAAVYIGGYYRAGDAFIPAFILEIASYTLGVSYDVNVSNLKTASSGRGGLEISLRFINPNPFAERASKQGPSFY